MNTITIKNLSTYADSSAVSRVALLLAGANYRATHDSLGNEVVRIVHRGNTYTVVDNEVHPHE